MIIKLKKKIICINEFKLKCSVGKGGIKKKIKEGDKITPKGTYLLGPLYNTSDIIKQIKSSLNCKIIKRNMGWCDDPRSKDYNREITINKNYKYSYEKLFRNDHKYDLLILIKYNYSKPIKNKGSAIFLHLTKDYKPTNGCISLKQKDFHVMLNLIGKKSVLKII